MHHNRYTLKLKESPTQNHKLCGMPFVSLFAGGVQRIIRLQNDESPAERCPFSRLRESV